MKNTFIQQEILLLAGTSFVSQQLMQQDDPGQQHGRNAQDQLEEACWNGLIKQMIPEIFEEPLGTKNLFMWKVTGGGSYIGIELGDIPLEKEKEFSIDPIAFLSIQQLS